MTTFRMHVKPQGGNTSEDPELAFNHCKKNGVLGMGWGVSTRKKSLSWPEYHDLALKAFGNDNISRVKYLHDNVKKGDLIWTRDANANYYLCFVTGGWEFGNSQEQINADIRNFCRCKFKSVNIDEVPGKIIACFRPPLTIQWIGNKQMGIYSQILWNKLSSQHKFKDIPQIDHHNIFSYLNSEACEDIIFIYLQHKGWIVIPNSRKGNTMKYEFYLLHKKKQARAEVQVKTGNVALNSKDYRKKGEKIFLFQTNGYYAGRSYDDVICLSPAKIEKFMREKSSIMPQYIKYWLDFTKR